MRGRVNEMNREILFRGKRLDNGEWIIGHLLTYEDGRARIIPSHTDIFCYEKDDSIIQTVAYPVDPATVGQYVGMPDKNRTKIFDGDLLKYTRGEDDAPYRVFWDNFGWYIQCESRMPDRLSGSQPENWEIIGNIYDNPELLV